ncbi:hypothetical protein BS78_K076000 [Paspalum vaginatum]|uniref:Uncharacterized protein n=1 Tax=Paspalum vaginatum TaxID=158149 RepID=A0A9W7XEV3_9POAL|nr:hypothetical protein BS78_K076000 [Paspalum vaginatum]
MGDFRFRLSGRIIVSIDWQHDAYQQREHRLAYRGAVGLEPACGQQRSWGPATAIPIFPIDGGRTVLGLFLIPSTAEPPLGPGVQILTQGQELLPYPQNSVLDCIDARSICLCINKLIFAFQYYYPLMLIFYFTFQISFISFTFHTDLMGAILQPSIDVEFIHLWRIATKARS